MCFIPPTRKAKHPSRPTPKVSLEGARIILGPDGARFSFSATSKLPSNLFIKQDFYPTDKTYASPHLSATLPTGPSPGQIWPHYTSQPLSVPPTPQGPDLVSQVAEAQRLAHNLTDACTPARSRSRSRSRDRHTLLLSIERKNAEDITALKLERDIERKVASAVRDAHTPLTASSTHDGCGGRGAGAEAWYWSMRGEQERQDRLLRDREKESERERANEDRRERERTRERKLIGGSPDAQMQLNLFQDLSGGGGGGGNGGNGGGRAGFVDGFREGWERRRSSVVSTLGAGARRLIETMARVEAEVDFVRRRERERERERRRGLF